MTSESPRAVVLAHVLPPYRDRSALLAAAWLRAWLAGSQGPLDAVTSSVDRFRHRDASSDGLLPELSRRLEVPSDAPPHAWASVREFAERGLDAVADSGLTHDVLLTPVPSGHGILLGALLKQRSPASRWVVHLGEMHCGASDRRPVAVPSDCPMREAMAGLLRERGIPPPDTDDAAAWLERVAMTADEVVVPTRAQWEALTTDEVCRPRSVVHGRPPLLGAGLYDAQIPDALTLTQDATDVAWVEDDLGHPLLKQVLDALGSLPDRFRTRLRLHLVVERPQAYSELITVDLARQVRLVPATDLGDRLAILRAVDVVLLLEREEPPRARGLRWSWVEAAGSGTAVVGVGGRGGPLAELGPDRLVPRGHRSALLHLLAELATGDLASAAR